MTSRLISSRFSAGTLCRRERNGVATARACSQTSSAVPGQVHGSVFVSSTTLLKPAFSSTDDKLPDAANLKGSGPPATSAGPPTCLTTMPIVLDQYGCSNGPQARKQARDPGFSTRCTSRIALPTILKEHHAETAGDEIEALLWKWKLLRVRLPGREIRQAALLSPFRGDFEKLAAQIEGRNMTFGAYARCQADCRFTRAASQIQDLHAGSRLRIFDQRFGDVAPHGGRFRLPFLGSDQAVGTAPLRI